jgi:hypothetical protein
MHKLIEYVCDRLEELEKKADKGGLSSSEIQYADTLAHLKKNLLKTEEMMGGDKEYSSRYYDGGMSYARKRDSMGRYSRADYGDYSRASEDMVSRLHDLMRDAPDEETKREIKRLIEKMER